MLGNKNKQSLKRYLDEISQVPSSLKDLAKYIDGNGKGLFQDAAQHIKKSKEIYFFGMASSQWASWPLAHLLERSGFNIHWMSAYDGLCLTDIPGNATLILVSQSGRTIEVNCLLKKICKCETSPSIIGLTNSLDSPLAEASNIVLDISAGPENHAPTKTYVNTVAALNILGSFIDKTCLFDNRDPVEPILDIAEGIKESNLVWQKWGETIASSWSEKEGPIFFLASGPQIASAWQSSMLCAETVRTFSAIGDWATFRHGFEPQVTESFFAIGFKPNTSDMNVNNTTGESILKRGGMLSIVPEMSVRAASINYNILKNSFSPIWETLPIHWFCINLAKYKGLNPANIERKVTLNL
jgi:glucosamine--fructose-6-phosphate aminotransferase (isomerizing)